MVVGVVGAARAMFISTHDLAVVLPVTLIAAVVASAVSWFLARQVIGDVRRVRATARSLGAREGSALPEAVPDARPVLRELAEIDAELISAGRRLATSRSREQALEASRRELIAWVSHDLRTPLAGLRAMAEALEDRVVDDPDRYHRQIRREVDRLSHLVDDLFELSRIRSGGLALSLQQVDARDLVADVVSGSAAVATAGGVALDAAVDPASLRIDAGGMNRAVRGRVPDRVDHQVGQHPVHTPGIDAQ